MKILAVSDQVVERLHTLTARDHFRDVGLILGCGDLPYEYLEFLVSMLNVPLLYVPGNHDPAHAERSAARAEGGLNLDGRVLSVGGLTLAGLGGSPRYREGVNQYSQAEMAGRVGALLFRILWLRLRTGRRLDVLITHTPPFGVHDEDTAAHQGFRAFGSLLRLARPRLHLHGHTYYLRNLTPSESVVGDTRVINVFPYKVIEIDER